VLDFIAADGLRPTSDRVRETLFNWLQSVIEGAHCLDLFAGSGALGLEAASRGAANVVMLDQHRQAVKQIQQHINTLRMNNVSAFEQGAEDYLQQSDESFDIVFIDPPYHSGLIGPVCQLLEKNGRLRPNARIYLESEKALKEEDLPQSWQLTRQKQAGQVFYHLATRR